jgi:hypothetical protein
MSFFTKKTQKTFGDAVAGSPAASENGQKFFASFFQKEVLP